MDITPAQSRAARGLLDWSQTELGRFSNLSESTIRDFEKGRRVPSVNNLAAILAAFQKAGVEFLNHGQPGVRMKKSKPSQAIHAGDRVRLRNAPGQIGEVIDRYDDGRPPGKGGMTLVRCPDGSIEEWETGGLEIVEERA